MESPIFKLIQFIMKKTSVLFILLLSILAFNSCSDCSQKNKAKYVFYFIGDGMGFSHVASTQAYLSYIHGDGIGREQLSFTKFPVLGMASTYSASNDITCSSAAGTALSTGHKTNNHFLGVAPDSSMLMSITYKIKEAGYKVGIMSNVSIDHATPASFYANSVSRSDYYPISLQLSQTGFDFFAGGGFIMPTGKDKDMTSAYEMAEEAGYTIAAGLKEFDSKKGDSQKMILLQNSGCDSKELPYVIDRVEGDLTLPDLVQSAIEFLEKDSKGFFMMAEGGRIDWAAHSNDAKATFLEVIDLSDAVEIAYQFYLKHPNETLIIVTADHETGGISLGYKSGYSVYFDRLASQTQSKDNSVDASSYEDAHTKGEIDDLNKEAKIGWTTGSHTGGNVPVFAIGCGSKQFAGFYDNTDIPKKVCSIMGVKY